MAIAYDSTAIKICYCVAVGYMAVHHRHITSAADAPNTRCAHACTYFYWAICLFSQLYTLNWILSLRIPLKQVCVVYKHRVKRSRCLLTVNLANGWKADTRGPKLSSWYYHHLQHHQMVPLTLNTWPAMVASSRDENETTWSPLCRWHFKSIFFNESLCISIQISLKFVPLVWRHNGRDGVSNHQPHDCLLNPSFRHRSKKTSKLCVTGLCAGNSPVTGEFPA